MPKVISDIECACGCETLMTIATVNRGWQYIRGHKPGYIRAQTKQTPKVPRQTPGKSSLDVATLFVRTMRDDLIRQLREETEKLEQATRRVEFLNNRLARLNPAVEIMEELNGETSSDQSRV